jgi:hypothetical protein
MSRLRIGFATLIRRASADKKSVPPVCSRQPLIALATWRGESHGFTLISSSCGGPMRRTDAALGRAAGEVVKPLHSNNPSRGFDPLPPGFDGA